MAADHRVECVGQSATPATPPSSLTGAVLGVLAAVVLVLGPGCRGGRPGPPARLPRRAARRARCAGRRSGRRAARRPAALTGSRTRRPRRLARVPRGDGRLNLDLDPADRGPQDACGVFGVWSGDRSGDDPTEVAKLTYFGLYALQHRGQESAGIAVSNGSQILVYKDMGLVAQVFDEGHLNSLRGHLAIGHTRYSTTGPASGRTPSRPSGPPPPARSRWDTTATSPTPATCSSWSRSSPPRAVS